MFRKRGFLAVGLVLICVCGVVFAADEAENEGKKPQEGIEFVVSVDIPREVKSDIPIHNNTLPSHIAVLRMNNLPRLSYSNPDRSSSSTYSSSSQKTANQRAAQLARQRALAAARARSRGRKAGSNDWKIDLLKEFNVYYRDAEFLDSLLESTAGKKLSDKSRDMIKAGKNYKFRELNDNCMEVKVYGYSKTDVEMAVHALIEAFESYIPAAREKTLNAIKEINENIDESQKMSDQKSKDFEQVNDAYNKAKKQGHYYSFDKVTDRRQGLNNLIDDKKIELDGLESQIREILKQISSCAKSISEMKKKHGNMKMESQSKLLARLGDMRSRATIDMARVKGQYESAVQIRAKAEEYIDLHYKRASSDRESKNATAALNDYKNQLSYYEPLTSKEKSEWFKPVVTDAVEIFSLESGSDSK